MPNDRRRRRLDEEQLRARLRIIAGIVILATIVLLAAVDTLGRLFIRPDFHVGDVFFGTLVGALLLILAVEGAAKFPLNGGGPK